MNLIYKNLNIKSLNDKTKIKNNITDNNISEINFTIRRIDEQNLIVILKKSINLFLITLHAIIYKIH